DLSGANLSGANLSGANLRDANLRDANLRDAIVVNALFGESLGLTEHLRHDLKRRGAIFGDRPPRPPRPPVFAPR
ncbi:pentapeptide repeat-containing protein, partial (plasmid) [Trichormus variabilis PNB]